jgi:teichuronic acid biosynthesis glycosyltransferase TuaC
VITYPEYRIPRKLLFWAVARAAGITSVCQALKDKMIERDAASSKIRVVLQGVDLEMFRPLDRGEIRSRLGLEGRVLLSVGHATRRKGHHLAIEALREMPETTLMIAGDGWYEQGLKDLADACGVRDRVRFLGHVDQEDLPRYYNAADALVLASSREGMANVLLESMACGTPVIATAVWGTPEAVACPEAGALMRERSAAALAEAARDLFARYPDREATRRYAAAAFPWEQSCRDHLEVLNAALAPPSPRRIPMASLVRP